MVEVTSCRPAGHNDARPLFSVIIPLGLHRGQWKRCLQGWQAQSLAKSRYEVVLVAPPAFPEHAQLAAWLAQADSNFHVVHSDLAHDISLSAFGAEHARGQFLFFTESHCWPEPDVLALSLRAFDQRPDWAGFSCRSLPVTLNRLAEAEAEMYDADITHGLTLHPWRKVLDQCFVTRRDAYARCGGLKPEFGHFSEWLLAASYHELGQFIGYLPDACFHHYYIGVLGEVRDFTLDFIRGEIRYLAGVSSEAGAHLVETPEEWFAQGNFDRRLALSLLRLALRNWWIEAVPSARREHLATAMRWLEPAIFDDRLSRAGSTVRVIPGYISARLANLFGSSQKLSKAFKVYLAALIHRQRLSSIASARRTRRATRKQGNARSLPCNIFAPDHAGFYPIEDFQGTRFRWSETAAMALIELPAGQHRICIDCAAVLLLPALEHLRFFLDGRPIPDGDVLIEPFRIIIKVGVTSPHLATLGWTCSRFAASNDPRRLGLPISCLKLDTAA